MSVFTRHKSEKENEKDKLPEQQPPESAKDTPQLTWEEEQWLCAMKEAHYVKILSETEELLGRNMADAAGAPSDAAFQLTEKIFTAATTHVCRHPEKFFKNGRPLVPAENAAVYRELRKFLHRPPNTSAEADKSKSALGRFKNLLFGQPGREAADDRSANKPTPQLTREEKVRLLARLDDHAAQKQAGRPVAPLRFSNEEEQWLSAVINDYIMQDKSARSAVAPCLSDIQEWTIRTRLKTYGAATVITGFTEAEGQWLHAVVEAHLAQSHEDAADANDAAAALTQVEEQWLREIWKNHYAAVLERAAGLIDRFKKIELRAPEGVAKEAADIAFQQVAEYAMLHAEYYFANGKPKISAEAPHMYNWLITNLRYALGVPSAKQEELFQAQGKDCRMAWHRSLNTVLGRAEYEAFNTYYIVPNHDDGNDPYTITDTTLTRLLTWREDDGWMQDRIDLVTELLERLPPEQQYLMKASAEDGKKSDEIAQEMGISTGDAVRKRKETIRKNLIMDFAKEWEKRFPGEAMWPFSSRARTVYTKEIGKKKRGKPHD